MLRIKLTKLKQVCATALIPKILKESKTFKKDIDKCAVDYFSNTTDKKNKSTDSGSKDENYQKRKAIIDQCFSEKPPIMHEQDTPVQPLAKDRVKLFKSEDKYKSFLSTFFGIDTKEKKVNEEVQQNANVPPVAAKVQEAKLADDIIHTDTALEIETIDSKDKSPLLENTNMRETLAQNVVQIDKTPHIEIDEGKVEEIGMQKDMSVLQHTHTYVISTAEDIGNDEKLAFNIVPIDKTPPVDSYTEVQQLDATLSVSEALQKDEDEAIAKELQNEKLIQHSYTEETSLVEPGVAKDNDTPKLSESEEHSTFKATTANVEEEKLTQKMDSIDEIPHVEAGVAKVEGFNVSPKILGQDSTSKLSTPEHFSDQPKHVNLDEVAKKCLAKSDTDVDQLLLKELKNISRIDSVKSNLPKDDSSQKCVSQVIQDKTKDNNNIVFDISDTQLKQILRNEIKDLTDNELKFDNFHPFHLDTVPILPTDTKGYKDELHRKYSRDKGDNILLDIPAVLDPYDMRAIPFYQYVSKENIILKDLHLDDQIQESSRSEVMRETEINIPMNEEVILKNEEETEDSREPASIDELKNLNEKEADREIATANTVKPLTENDPYLKSTDAHALSESDVSKLLEYKNVLTAQQEAVQNINCDPVSTHFFAEETGTKQSSVEGYPPENATETVLTTSTTTPTDPFGNPLQTEASLPKSFDSDSDKRSDEARNDSAISAHQEPDEYFPTNNLSNFKDVDIHQADYVVPDSGITYTGVFDMNTTCCYTTDDTSTDNLMSQSISYYSTFPQLSDVSGYSYDTSSQSKYKLDKKEHITHVLTQPEPKREDGREKFVQPAPRQTEFYDATVCPNPTQEEFREPIGHQETRRKEKVNVSDIKDVDLSDETTPLSVLLRRVRERSRMEFIKSVNMEAVVAKSPPCIPPLDRSKPKTTMHPSPCQPKPKEQDSKEKCPSPCKPKKDPCAKFIPFLLHTVARSNLDAPLPPTNRFDQMCTYISFAKEIACKKLKHLRLILGFPYITYHGDEVDVVCARDFNPWVPIPSWPISKVEKERPFVCPKEGCKLPVHPVRSNTDKPCLGMPKKLSPSKTVNCPKLVHHGI